MLAESMSCGGKWLAVAGATGIFFGAFAAKLRAAPEIVVHQIDRAFAPDRLTVATGTPVKFVNDEAIVHHAYVEAPGFSVDSGDIRPGSAATLVFDKQGRFAVRCAIHPRMRLDIEVTP